MAHRHPSNEYIFIIKGIFIVKLSHKDSNIDAANKYILLTINNMDALFSCANSPSVFQVKLQSCTHIAAYRASI